MSPTIDVNSIYMYTLKYIMGEGKWRVVIDWRSQGYDWSAAPVEPSVVGKRTPCDAIGHECPEYDWLGSFIECICRKIHLGLSNSKLSL